MDDEDEQLLSPNPTTFQKQRQPRTVQSPLSPFFLGSNDDNRERAQARAARAAAIRRKSIAAAARAPEPEPYLGKQQILELYQNCIKLASENKINQKNTWDLTLIDHLTEIIKAEDEGDTETNFQKASCTLEAGVKIYSLRVDSVHSEAYKVLGGMNRAGQENQQDNIAEDGTVNSEQDEGRSKKELDKKISPLSTLEASFEALNVKKFDVAFAVDPLYHQMSAQFDEGGAKGLLLNNLGVYGGCRVLFDSFEVPGCMSCPIQHDKSDIVDFSFAREQIEQMVLNMRIKDEISPTLKNIINQFDEDNLRPQDTFSSTQKPDEHFDATYNDDETQLNGDSFDNCTFDQDDQTSAVGEDFNDEEPGFPSYNEEYGQPIFQEPDMDDRFDKVDRFLFLGLGLTSKQNAWAGPDHWKYRKAKEVQSTAETGSAVATKRPRRKNQAENDINFIEALDKEFPDLFAPPKNLKSLLLPANRKPCNKTLPEDCHYQPENLVKLFLLPNIMCLGRKCRKPSDESRRQYDDHGEAPSWDAEDRFDDQYDDGNGLSDVDDTLVSQPRQVNKIEVKYDKTSKQVDVQALKDTLWDHLQDSTPTSVLGQDDSISFKHILANIPGKGVGVASVDEISPHLCFICLLHLANEHNLSIHGCTNMDDLTIHLPHSDAH